MNKTEQAQMTEIRRMADELMDGNGNGITDADVVYALMGDIERVQNGQAPKHLATLLKADNTVSESAPGGDYTPIIEKMAMVRSVPIASRNPISEGSRIVIIRGLSRGKETTVHAIVGDTYILAGVAGYYKASSLRAI